MKVICQICQEEIAILTAVSYPLIGSMFASIEPERGIPSPFQPDDTWELFKCPFGPHRPLVRPDQILTSEGILNVPKNGDAPFYSPKGHEIDRTDVFDREMEQPPVMSEAQAEALVRAQMGEGTFKVHTSIDVPEGTILFIDEKNIRLKGVIENGEADAWKGKPEDEKPLESKEEESETDGKQDAGKFVCEQCSLTFKNKSGLTNHKRFKHGKGK